MSYILDALKKSERERSGVRAGDALGDESAANARSPWPLAIALVLTSNALLGLGWWAWQRSADDRQDADSPSTGAAANATDPRSVPTIPLAPITPPVESAPSAPAGKTPVGDLAAEARRTPAPAPVPRLRANAKPMEVFAAPAAPAPVPTDAGVHPVIARPTATSVPWLRELPAAFRTAVAPLNVNIHVYAGTSEDSVLYINDRQYRAGETLPNGVRLDAVVADGAVLSYQGQQFKLPRPN